MKNIITTLAFLCSSICYCARLLGAEPCNAPYDPPGVVIDVSPDFDHIHIGSPSIEIMPDGTYVASHDFFGDSPETDRSTFIFESRDRGASWKKIGRIPRQQGAYLFYAQGALWSFGWTPGKGYDFANKDTQCKITLVKSADGGHTWTSAKDSKSGVLIGGAPELSVFCDPAPVLIHNGRVWKEVEKLGSFDPNSKPRNWLTQYSPIVASAPIDSNLLDANSWTFSPPLAWKTLPNLGGWAEGNVLFTPEGKMIVQMRVDDDLYDGKGARIHVSDDGKTTSFDPNSDFVDMPGGTKKFVIKYDETTQKYWSFVNWIHPDDADAPNKERVRNTLALVCSSDLRTWEIRCVIYRRLDRAKGFQYVDWRIDGDDAVCVCRLAWDGAPNSHDANHLTFFRVERFRELTREDDAQTWK